MPATSTNVTYAQLVRFIVTGTLLAPNAPLVLPVHESLELKVPVTFSNSIVVPDIVACTTPVAPVVACVIVSPAVTLMLPVTVNSATVV